MTPYEYMDLAQGAGANAVAMVTFGFTIMCGYLFVAYTIGAKLTRRQVYAITFIYTMSTLTNTVGHLSAIGRSVEYAKLAGEVSTESAPILVIGMVSTILLIRASIFAVSLWFMWDIRRKKA